MPSTNFFQWAAGRSISRESVQGYEQLAKWCKTDGIYSEGMQVARHISRLLFGDPWTVASKGIANFD